MQAAYAGFTVLCFLIVPLLDGKMCSFFTDGSLKWKKKFGDDIWTSPALQDGGRAIFMGTMAEDGDSFFALDGNTGDIIWKQNLGPLFSSPTLSSDNQVRYTGFPAHLGNRGKLFNFFPVREKTENLKKMPQIREKSGNFDWPKIKSNQSVIFCCIRDDWQW